MSIADAPWLVEFENVTSSGHWSDCTFVFDSSERNEVPAHKLILAMASPSFKEMFHERHSEHNEPMMIPISDFKQEVFEALLKFIYTGRIGSPSVDLAKDLWLGAKEYKLPLLQKKCVNYLCSVVGPSNACKVYEVASQIDDKALKDICIQTISANTNEVLNDKSFKDASLDTVLMVLSLDDLNVESELVLFDAVVNYEEARKKPGQSSSPLDGPDGEPSAEGLSESVEPPISEDQAVLNSESSSPNIPAVELDSKEPSEEVVTSEPPADSGNFEEGEAIQELMKKIRFLSLTPQQFAEGPGGSKLLPKDQRFTILMNISLEDIILPMPAGFSESKEGRQHRNVDDQGASAKSHLKRSSDDDGSRSEDCGNGDAATKSPTPAEIVKDLASRDQHSLKAAARAARILTADDASEKLDQLVEAGVVPQLVAVLNLSWSFFYSSGVQYDAAWALTNIAQEHKHTKTVVNDGAVSKLLSLLDHDDGDLAEQATLALGHIAQSNRKSLDDGALIKIQSKMIPSTPAKQLVACLWTYGIICEHEPQYVRLSPALPYISTLLAMSNEQVLVEACSVLFYLTGELHQNAFFVFDSKLTARLTALLGHATPRVQAAAFKALENVMANNVLKKQCLRGFLDQIINWLKCGNPSHVEDAARAVVNILRGTPSYIKQVLDKGILEALVPALTEGNDKCKVQAVIAVTAVCAKGSASQLCKLAYGAALEPYCQLLHDTEYSYDVLRGLTLLLQNIELNARDTLCLKLVKFDVPKLLIPMQEHKDELVRERADLLLKTYFVDDVNEKGRL